MRTTWNVAVFVSRRNQNSARISSFINPERTTNLQVLSHACVDDESWQGSEFACFLSRETLPVCQLVLLPGVASLTMVSVGLLCEVNGVGLPVRPRRVVAVYFVFC
jgi:hypothetical protein